MIISKKVYVKEKERTHSSFPDFVCICQTCICDFPDEGISACPHAVRCAIIMGKSAA